MNDSIYTGPVPDRIRHLLELAHARIAEGCVVHYKFTCLHCRSRQTIEQPNTFFKIATCEECKKESDLFQTEAKPDFLVIMATTDPVAALERIRRNLKR